MQGELVFNVDSDFYGLEKIEVKRLAELISEVNSVNLIGEKSVSVALEKGFVNEGSVKHIAGVPHVQIFKM